MKLNIFQTQDVLLHLVSVSQSFFKLFIFLKLLLLFLLSVHTVVQSTDFPIHSPLENLCLDGSHFGHQVQVYLGLLVTLLITSSFKMMSSLTLWVSTCWMWRLAFKLIISLYYNLD